MKPPAFEYLRPANLGEALHALAQHRGNARLLAGGQSLVPMMNMRLVHPAMLIDINRLPGLADVRVDGGTLVIGALARHTQLAESPLVAQHCPLMAEAYPHVAHKPIRNRGTLGGNISHADPASEMPAVLLASDATIVARSASGQRSIKAQDFFTGPMQTALAPEEMVVEVRIPCAPATRGHAFEEESNRRGDFAMAAVAVTIDVKDGNCTRCTIAVSGMGDCAVRLASVESGLPGKAANDALAAQAARAARDAVNPSSSYHADAEYKRDLVEALTERALKRAISRAK